VLDIIRKKIFSVFLNRLYCLLNRRFLMVIQCFFPCIFMHLDFLMHDLDFFNYFVIFVICFCECNTILMVCFFINSI
jgi:hypothetical protein